MEQMEIRGYVDPRTGEYVRTNGDTDPQKVHEDLAFIAAWRHYWDGPLAELIAPVDDVDNGRLYPVYDRERWLASGKRKRWLAGLTEEQRQMLADVPPPEEVPALAE
jgi:hypothetical protein